MNESKIQPDNLGRRGFGMQHQLTNQQLSELRNTSVFIGANDEQIKRIMNMMGPNYSWPASDSKKQAKRGILVLSHGLGVEGDRALRERIQKSDIGLPVVLAFGMSMITSEHIKMALDELLVAGVQEIVVIPVLSTHKNSLMRQWQYIFGEREDPEYTTVDRVSSPMDIILTDALDDHPIVGSIVASHAREASIKPMEEQVIIVGHGPVGFEDNLQQLSIMENIANFVRADRSYYAVHVASLQDDAPREVRTANLQKIRDVIQNGYSKNLKTIIVTNLLGSRIVQSSLRKGLSGLEYRFNSKGLIANDLFINWIEESANNGSQHIE
ncbi:MAG: hypothetical protein VYA80_02815 [Pseudomonadota bacterium]|nr:hypothetical protein [Pseudomonadota bacterium]